MVQQDLPALGTGAEGQGSGAGSSAGGAAAAEERCARAAFMADNPAILQKFSQDLLPLLVQVRGGAPAACCRCCATRLPCVLRTAADPARPAAPRAALQVYGSTVQQEVRRRCLATVNKLLYFCPPPLLAALLADVNIASFAATLLGSRDWHVVAAALHAAEILMAKAPESFAPLFVKEGVAHALEALAAQAPPPPPPKGALRAAAAARCCCRLGRSPPPPGRRLRGRAGAWGPAAAALRAP
jgi:hypothetical protein